MSNHKHRPKKVHPIRTVPRATAHLNYRGKITGNVGRIMGPNLLREHLTVVEEIYDAESDMTRVGLAYGVHELVQA